MQLNLSVLRRMAIQRQFIRELSFGRLSVVNEMAIPFSRLHSNANAYRGWGGGGGVGFTYYYRSQIKFAKVMFSQVFVCPRGLSVGGGGFCPRGRGLCPRGRGLCPGGSVSRGGLCQGGSLSGGGLGGLCPGGSLSRGLCRGETGFLSRMD